MGKDLKAMELATYLLEGHSRKWDSMCQRPEVEMCLESEEQQEQLCGQVWSGIVIVNWRTMRDMVRNIT